MLVPDTTPIFPECPSYGFTSQPDYLVKKITREGGYERVDRKWSQPLHLYEGVPLGPRAQEDIENILRFWHALGGTSTRFRFTDQADCKSCSLGASVSPLDQPIQTMPGSPGGLQLSKQYVEGGLSLVRPITRPVGSTIRIANNLGVEQAASTWTLDESTGFVTAGIGFAGVPATWGGEFYVWCRFNGSLRVEVIDKKILGCSCSIRESRRTDL